MMSLHRNTLWNLIGTGAPFLIGIFTIPYIKREAGVEILGALTLVWALIGYFSFFDFGIGKALTQQVSKFLATESYDLIPEVVKNGLIFTLLAGVAGGTFLALFAESLAFHWLGVTSDLQEGTFHALLLAAIGIPIVTITAGFRGVIEAFEDFKDANIWRFFLGAANFAFPALCIYFLGPHLEWMVGSLIFARVLIAFAYWRLVCRRFPKGFKSTNFEFKKIKSLWTFGAWMTVSNVVSPLMGNCDRFVISSVLGASVVAFYTIPFEVLVRILIVPVALTGAVFPRITSLLVLEKDKAQKLYGKVLFIVFIIMVLICVPTAIFSKWWLLFWLGEQFSKESSQIVIVICMGLIFHGVAQVPFTLIQAAGRVNLTAKLHVCELIFYVPALLGALHYYGLIGASVVWSLRVFIDFVVMMIFAKNIWNE